MINVIAAVGPKWEIGVEGRLPWPRHDADMRHFQKTTMGHIIIMGRATFESIGSKPLSGRRNIIVSVSMSRQEHEDYEVYSNMADAFDACRDDDRLVFVIGGESVFRYALPFARKVYLTQMPRHSVEKADRFMPCSGLIDGMELFSGTQGDTGEVYNVLYARSEHDSTYLDLLEFVLWSGEKRLDRTGTGTLSVFGARGEYDLRDGFPLITTKRVFWRGVVAELLWMIKGSTSAKDLADQGVNIWNEWADEYGELGPVYGKQWRAWSDGFGGTIDQLKQVIDSIKTNPYSRRHIVSAWNVADLEGMALPPCHMMYQFYVSNDGYLDLQLYQRSADLFLGVPFNIASYSLLLMIVARLTGLQARWFTHVIGDAHVYLNHVDQVKEQLERTPRWAPKVHVDFSLEGASIDDVNESHIHLTEYEPHSVIKGEISV